MTYLDSTNTLLADPLLYHNRSLSVVPSLLSIATSHCDEVGFVLFWISHDFKSAAASNNRVVRQHASNGLPRRVWVDWFVSGDKVSMLLILRNVRSVAN